jgi:O-antigen ligase
MLTKTTEKIVSFLVLIAGPAVGLFITPSVSTDPVNQPKMLLLTSIAFAAVGVLLFNPKSTLLALNNRFGWVCSVFVLQLFLVLFFAPAPKDQQVFGVFGRNTGLLTYLSLVIICICAYLISNSKNLEKIVVALIVTGVVSAIYSGMQTFGVDPVKWQNPYNSITAFLGNPNFQSSFLAISSIASLGLFLRNQSSLLIRASSIIYISLSIFLIVRSNSQQGILVFGAGAVIVFSLFLIGTPRLAKKFILYPYFLITGVIGILVVFGMLNHGPLAQIIYKLSVRQRGFYWHAAVEMMKSHPFFGVGMDSYGSWYFEVRSKNAAFHTPQTGSNAAHNVFLDLGAYGGLPLFVVHLALVILTIWSIFKILRRGTGFNWSFAALVGAWAGYEAQSIISINQIGLAVWGWLIMGFIIGYERYEEKSQNSSAESKRVKKSKNQMGGQVFSCVAGAALGMILVLPVFNADASYRKAVSTGNGDELLRAAQAKPTDTYRLIQSAQVFANSNLIEQAKNLIDLAIEHNPRSYDAWELKRMLTDKNNPEYQEITSRLNKLNPNVAITQ